MAIARALPQPIKQATQMCLPITIRHHEGNQRSLRWSGPGTELRQLPGERRFFHDRTVWKRPRKGRARANATLTLRRLRRR